MAVNVARLKVMMIFRVFIFDFPFLPALHRAGCLFFVTPPRVKPRGITLRGNNPVTISAGDVPAAPSGNYEIATCFCSGRSESKQHRSAARKILRGIPAAAG